MYCAKAVFLIFVTDGEKTNCCQTSNFKVFFQEKDNREIHTYSSLTNSYHVFHQFPTLCPLHMTLPLCFVNADVQWWSFEAVNLVSLSWFTHTAKIKYLWDRQTPVSFTWHLSFYVCFPSPLLQDKGKSLRVIFYFYHSNPISVSPPAYNYWWDFLFFLSRNKIPLEPGKNS